MKIRKKYIIFTVLFTIFFGSIFCKESAKARTYNLQIGKMQHIEVECGDNATDSFRIPHSYCYFTVKITNIHLKKDNKYYDEYLKHVMVDDAEKSYYVKNGSIIFKMNGNLSSEEREFSFALEDVYILDELMLLDSSSISCDIMISPNSVPKLSKKSVTCYLNELKTITLKDARSDVKWSITNKKVAKIHKEKNKVEISPKKIGTCYVKAKSGGITYKCKVKVKGRKYLYAGGWLVSYNTRKNTFEMEFQNYSNKTVKIKSSGAIAVDSDYTSYDRNLKLAKTISVKPGKVKYLKFKVIGNPTWYDVNDFCINYTAIYKGKKYRMASDTETTWVRRKGKWKKLLTFY